MPLSLKSNPQQPLVDKRGWITIAWLNAFTSSAGWQFLVDLATEVTGILAVIHGGTGRSALTTHGVVIGQGTSTLAVTSAGTAGQVLTSGGAAADPTFQNPATAGTVTHTGNLDANHVILGNGGADITELASLGTTTTLLHGNAAGAPSFTTVTEADLTLANVTTNNVSTTKHGFTPILPNDATKFLDGTGAYTVPAGSGSVTHTGTLTSGRLIQGNGGADITVNATTATVTKLTAGVPSAASAGTDYVAPGSVTTDGITMTTARLLGRTTASTGAIEEITAGTGLTLSGGTLTATGTGGTVTTTGSPASGNLTKFSGATAVTNGDLTGDVTTAGALTTTLANIPTATPMAGSVLATAISAPGTPASGKASVYVDATSKNLSVKNDAGTVNHGVQTLAAVAGQFVTAIDADGTAHLAAPAVLGTAIAGANVNTDQNTSSTSYTDLATSGPAVTVTTGTSVIVIISGLNYKNGTGNTAWTSVAVSGATTLAASDANGTGTTFPLSIANVVYSRAVTLTGLTAGSNTFTCKYRVDGGLAIDWYNRSIVVIAL